MASESGSRQPAPVRDHRLSAPDSRLPKDYHDRLPATYPYRPAFARSLRRATRRISVAGHCPQTPALGGAGRAHDPDVRGSFDRAIPDPGNAATLNNSSPDMGDYPLDAYLCVNSPKMFQFNVTDIDGDSLVYSLVTPLDDGTMNAAPTFPYNNVAYAGGYSLANMVGGVPPMTINQNTGVITASPALIGTWVFGVLVEEFRNGVKIGETRRDAQYESQACTSGNPPSFLNTVPSMGQTIEIPYNREYCLDLIFNEDRKSVV